MNNHTFPTLTDPKYRLIMANELWNVRRLRNRLNDPKMIADYIMGVETTLRRLQELDKQGDIKKVYAKNYGV